MLLDELAKIIRCKKETKLTILLIFYHVDPSSHAYNLSAKREKLRNLSEKMANIPGWQLLERYFSWQIYFN